MFYGKDVVSHHMDRTHQDCASETLQKIQQLPPILQVTEHVFDGCFP